MPDEADVAPVSSAMNPTTLPQAGCQRIILFLCDILVVT